MLFTTYARRCCPCPRIIQLTRCPGVTVTSISCVTGIRHHFPINIHELARRQITWIGALGRGQVSSAKDVWMIDSVKPNILCCTSTERRIVGHAVSSLTSPHASSSMVIYAFGCEFLRENDSEDSIYISYYAFWLILEKKQNLRCIYKHLRFLLSVYLIPWVRPFSNRYWLEPW